MGQDICTGKFLTVFFEWLNNHCPYAVLRNYAGLPMHNDSRDIDIAIEKDVYNRQQSEMLTLVEREGWQVVTLLVSDRLVTWVCGCIAEDGKCSVVQLDFFFNTSIFGIELLSSREVIAHKKYNGKVYHADIEHEFLDKYLYDRAVGVTYPDKYAATRQSIEDSSYVKEVVKKVFGCQSLTDCDNTSRKRLLFNALRYNLRYKPLGMIITVPRFEFYHVYNYFHSTGFSIGFTGPDGSGKTTVIDLMIEQLGDVFRTAHTYFHFRPALFGNLGEVAHGAGIKKEVDRDYSKPHRGGKTGVLSSLLRLGYYAIDYIVGYFTKIKSVIRITRLAIFDRYYTDIICDSRRSRIYLPPKFLYWFGRLFIPSLDYNILLTADTGTILQRKRELDNKGIEAINAKINYLANKKGYYRILNNGTPQEAVVKILRIVFEEQHKKNAKRVH